jgi:hypothetical protein
MSLRGVGLAFTAGVFVFGGFVACVDDSTGSSDETDGGAVEASGGDDAQGGGGGFDASADGASDVTTGTDAAGSDATGTGDAQDSGADTGPVCVPGCSGNVLTTCLADGGSSTDTCANGCGGDAGLAHCFACTPGTVEQEAAEPCGTLCGTQTPTRTCQADGTLGAPVAGTCMNEGVCTPGAMSTIHDHRCVICSVSGNYATDTTTVQTCNANCQWSQTVTCGTPCTP